MSRDADAWDRMLESMWTFFPSVAATSEGGELLELDGVVGTVTRAVPERSIANSVLYRREDDLERALPELARAYEGAGILAWTVWVPHYHERAKRALADAGHVLDADPEAMIASLDDVEPPRPGDPEPDPEPTRGDLARVNDLAYGTGDAFARLFGDGPPTDGFTWVAREDGHAVATTVSVHHRGDCSIWWVATVPQARGRGLASGLIRRALAHGRGHDCEITTLQATKMGQPAYERLGYRGLGAIEMWERRRSSPGA
jgi:ribosomal protein S18 acetylase RimI-like enzyme